MAAPLPSKPGTNAARATGPAQNAAVVQVIVGEDAFLLGEAIAAFRRAQHAPPPGDLNAERFDLAKDTLDRLLEAARTLPMLAPRRFVQGDNLDGLPAAQHRALLAFLDAPSPRCTLLLTAKKLDGRLKLSQALKAQKRIQTVELPKPRDVVGWVLDRARAVGLRLGPPAAAALVQRVGPNFGTLASNLGLLQIYAGEAATIDADDVRRVVAPTREAHVFELTAALGRRSWPACSQLLSELLADGQSPLLVLAMIARQLRLLLAAKRWRGGSGGLAEAVGVRPFVAEALLQDARRTSEHVLLHGLREAQACDLALKTSSLPARAALERLLLAATGGHVPTMG